MTSSHVWDRDTATRYDETSAPMFAPEVLDPTVSLLAHLADGGPALEFAVGTGRVALPLLEKGVDVTGIELSKHMVGVLRQKVSEDRLPVVVGDMATTQLAGRYRLVYLVWNAVSNLLTEQEQIECFRNAARHLVPGGRFVVELWVPRPPVDGRPAVTEWSDEHICIDTYDVAGHMCTSHHWFLEPDGRFRRSAGQFRYAWPDECDAFAELAGLQLEARYANWREQPFNAESESHVSVWRKPIDSAEVVSAPAE